MININISSIDKLLDILARGLGAIAAPFLTRIMAKANASALLTEAKAKADALAIGAKSQSESIEILSKDATGDVSKDISIGEVIEAKIQFQERRRLNNIYNIMQKTMEKLPEKVPDNKIDDDWIARFFQHSQDVSSEELQNIWASVLAGQVNSSNTTSLRTLDVLRNMTQKDALLFEKCARYIVSLIGGIFFESKAGAIQIAQDLSYSDYRYLVEIGLLGETLASYYSRNDKIPIENPFHLGNLSNIALFVDNLHEFEFPNIPLSSVGKELFRYVNKKECSKDYIQSISDYIKRVGGTLLLQRQLNPHEIQTNQLLTFDQFIKTNN